MLPLPKIVPQFHKTCKGKVSKAPASPPLKRYPFTRAHRSTIYKGQRVEANSRVHWQMNKENVAYALRDTLFSFKMEENPGTCRAVMNLEHIMLSEISQFQKDK